MLEEELAEPALVKAQDGTKYYVSKDRAFVKQLINDSFSGKARDKKLLLDVMFRVAEPHYPENDAASEMVAGGADALDRYVQRVRRREEIGDTAPDDGEDPP